MIKSTAYPYNTINGKDFFVEKFGLRFHFNGKENDNEVKGAGNSIDYGDRIYDSRLARWTAIDPRFREYTSISPYSFGLNNPIYFKDADGRVIVDGNGKPVTIGPPQKKEDGTYTSTFAFVDGTSQKVKDEFNKNGGRVVNALIQTPTGREQVQKAIDSKNKIHVNISPKTQVEWNEENDPNDRSNKISKQSETFGETVITEQENNIKTGESVLSTEVTIYEGTIKFVEKSTDDPKAQFWKDNNATREQKVAGVAGHEFEHGTNPKHIEALKKGNLSSKDHKEADIKENKIITKQ